MRSHAEAPFETQITRLVDAKYPVELKPRYLIVSLLRTKGELVRAGLATAPQSCDSTS